MAKAKSEAASEGAATSNDSSAPTEETSSALVPRIELPVVETVSVEPAATTIELPLETSVSTTAAVPEALPVVETVEAVQPEAPKVEPQAPVAPLIANPIAPPPVVSAPPPVTLSKELSMPSDKSTSRSARGPRIKVHEHGNITWDGLVYVAGKTYELDTVKHSKKDFEDLLESGTIVDLDKLEAGEEISEPEPVL